MQTLMRTDGSEMPKAVFCSREEDRRLRWPGMFTTLQYLHFELSLIIGATYALPVRLVAAMCCSSLQVLLVELHELCNYVQAFAERHKMPPEALPTMMQVRLQELEGMGILIIMTARAMMVLLHLLKPLRMLMMVSSTK